MSTVQSVNFAEYSRYEVHPELTTLAVAHRNADMNFIADAVMPRALNVSKKEFKYSVYNEQDYLTVPNTRVGRKGQPGQVDSGGKLVTQSVEDYGLQDTIPMDDISQEENVFNNQRAQKVMQLTDLIMLDREKRVAGIVANPDNYADNLKVAVAANSRWNKDEINILKLISSAATKTFMKPNIAVTSVAGWHAIRTHPSIVSAVQANDGKSGIVSRMQVAELFEVDEILVGETWMNQAKRGKEVQLDRLWGNHFSLHHRKRQLSGDDTPSHGTTAEWRNRRTHVFDARPGDVGIDGGVRVVVGESVQEFIIDPKCGYLFQNIVA